ncbi:MAG: hypothetical protein AAGD96_00760 [Chloroflexota bacterium]
MNNQSRNYMGFWIAIGVGGALSVAMDDHAVSWALGIGVGVAMGSVMNGRESTGER